MSTFVSPSSQGRLLSCRAASVILDVSDDTVRRLANEGILEAVRIGRKIIRVSEASVQAVRIGKNGGAV